LTLACLAAPTARAEEPLRIAGTGTAVAALNRVGTAAQQGGAAAVRLQVLPSLGSTGAIHAVADGAIDLGVTGRPLRDAERARGLAEREVARTPFVFAVGPRVGVAVLTTDDLVAIYQGTRLTWPDGQRVRPVLRPEADSDTEILRAISPEMAAAVDAAARRPGMLLGVTNVECNEIVARSPGSIGPTTLLQIRSEPLPIRPLSWNGIEPTLENLASGRYPLVKSIRLVYRSPAPEGVRKFVAYLGSPAGRSLLRELGALPLDFSPAE
jgi:phosphate transport system substrate-binding protein